MGWDPELCFTEHSSPYDAINTVSTFQPLSSLSSRILQVGQGEKRDWPGARDYSLPATEHLKLETSHQLYKLQFLPYKVGKIGWSSAVMLLI